MLLPKLKASRPLADHRPHALLPMRNDAFPAPPSPINTALSRCIKGGFFLDGRGALLKLKRGEGRKGGKFETGEGI